MNALTLYHMRNETLVRDIDLAERLGMVVPRKIRSDLIEANREELETFGTLWSERLQTGGRPATVFYLNEEQALLVCMFSKTENAALVRKQVVETFIAHRRGQLVAPQAPALPNFADPTAAARAWAEAYVRHSDSHP